MDLVIPLLIFLTIILIYYIYRIIIHKLDYFSIDNNILQESSLDGRRYYVHSRHENTKLAANTFARIDKNINSFLQYLYNKYKNSTDPKRKEVALLLIKRYHTSSLRENSPLNAEKDTSYTVNKGDVIAVCIRSGIDYGIHDIGTIMFVVFHELSHIAIRAYDHPDEFWQVFKFILQEAQVGGFYENINYALYPTEYCGIEINYSPYYDQALSAI